MQPISGQRLAPTILWVFAIYYSLQIIVRMALPDGLRIDEAQQVFFSQWFVAGYNAQPPLYNWLQLLTFAIVGDYLVGLAVLKSVVLFAILASYYALARMLLKTPAYAVLATLGLFIIPQMFWQAQRDLTHTTATMLLLNLLLIAALQVLRTPSLWAYVLLGASVGLGMLTKYNFALFLPALAVAVWFHPDGRRRIFDWRMLPAILVAALIILPHAIWFVGNIQAASSVTLSRMGEEAAETSRVWQIGLGLFNLAASTVLMALPAVLLFALAFAKVGFGQARASSVECRFVGAFLATILIVLALMIFATTFTTFRDRWMLPLLQVLPIYFALQLENRGVDPLEPLRRIMPGILMMVALLPIATFAAGYFSASHYQQPYTAFRSELEKREGTSPALIVTKDWLVAGNAKLQWPGVPVMTTQFPELEPAGIDSGTRPVMLLWRGRATEPPKGLLNWAKSRLGETVNPGMVKNVTLPYDGPRNETAPPFHYILIAG
jgi:4-amino-4-deoxy-L-arabinose transferase-like glycosyltransferase